MMFTPVPTSNARQGVGSHLHLPIALQSLLKNLGQSCLGQRIILCVAIYVGDLVGLNLSLQHWPSQSVDMN